jgi:hypothetical protein
MYTNRRHTRLHVFDDSVMRDATIETHDRCVSVLHADVSQIKLSHVVKFGTSSSSTREIFQISVKF